MALTQDSKLTIVECAEIGLRLESRYMPPNNEAARDAQHPLPS